MTELQDLVFLFDVDNTLLDNDKVRSDLRDHLEASYGAKARHRYWPLFASRKPPDPASAPAPGAPPIRGIEARRPRPYFNRAAMRGLERFGTHRRDRVLRRRARRHATPRKAPF